MQVYLRFITNSKGKIGKVQASFVYVNLSRFDDQRQYYIHVSFEDNSTSAIETTGYRIGQIIETSAGTLIVPKNGECNVENIKTIKFGFDVISGCIIRSVLLLFRQPILKNLNFST